MLGLIYVLDEFPALSCGYLLWTGDGMTVEADEREGQDVRDG